MKMDSSMVQRKRSLVEMLWDRFLLPADIWDYIVQTFCRQMQICSQARLVFWLQWITSIVFLLNLCLMLLPIKQSQGFSAIQMSR